MRTLVGIGGCVMIFFITALFASIFVDSFIGAMVLAIIVSAVICCIWVLPYCTMIVPANKAWILANTFETESAVEQENFSGYRQIRAQKEFQAGFHWKYFWENPDKEIDMSRQIPVENDPDQPYTLSDGKTITIKWRIFCEPLPGNVVNYIRTKPEDIQRRVKDRVESFLQGYIGSLKSVGFGAEQMKAIKDAFVLVYKGPTEIDEEERQLGIWTGTPEIVDIDQPKEVQEAKNFETEMQTNIDLAKNMVERSQGGIRFPEAMKMVLIGKGKFGKIDLVELAGVFPSGQIRNKKERQNADN